jgi:hypothetical protein
VNILQEKSTVIVIFAGLMVFHYNEPLRYFKVGILKAPHHEFEVYNPNASKVDPAKTTARTTAQQDGYPDEMVLEVVDDQGNSTSSEAAFYQQGNGFDRTIREHDPEDYRYMITFDDLYRTDGHSIKDGSLGPNIYIRAGKLYTQCRTDFLQYKKRIGNKMPYGFAADIMKLEVELKPDQSLVLRDPRLEALLKVPYKAGEQYVLIANVPDLDHRCSSPNKNKAEHCKDFDTHFQYYYNAIPKNLLSRYDFGHKDPGPQQYACPNLAPQIAEYLRRAGHDEYLKKTPPPFFCGIASTSREWSITNSQSMRKPRLRSKKH